MRRVPITPDPVTGICRVGKYTIMLHQQNSGRWRALIHGERPPKPKWQGKGYPRRPQPAAPTLVEELFPTRQKALEFLEGALTEFMRRDLGKSDWTGSF